VWLESPKLVLLAEGEGFAETWQVVLAGSGVTGGAVHDARVAAL
jgi:hypothetical protein